MNGTLHNQKLRKVLKATIAGADLATAVSPVAFDLPPEAQVVWAVWVCFRAAARVVKACAQPSANDPKNAPIQEEKPAGDDAAL